MPPGNKSIEELCKEGIFPDFKSLGRDAKFPKGESLNDLARRVEEAIKEFILPHLFTKSQEQVHIAFASHGLCISETIAALLRLDPEAEQLNEYRGHQNTGWSQLEISLKVNRAELLCRKVAIPTHF
jgi:broad specificity phosphatase PhoE